MKSIGTASKILILHDIRSAQNVGALFRTADAAGIDMIYLSSTTPHPVDRFGRARTDIAKTALGAEQSVVWESYDDIEVLLQHLRAQHVQLIAVEQSEHAMDYKDVTIQTPVAFILGNEVGGIAPHILELVDVTAVIPMHGTKESLNVSVAGGIALFRLLGL